MVDKLPTSTGDRRISSINSITPFAGGIKQYKSRLFSRSSTRFWRITKKHQHWDVTCTKGKAEIMIPNVDKVR